MIAGFAGRSVAEAEAEASQIRRRTDAAIRHHLNRGAFANLQKPARAFGKLYPAPFVLANIPQDFGFHGRTRPLCVKDQRNRAASRRTSFAPPLRFVSKEVPSYEVLAARRRGYFRSFIARGRGSIVVPEGCRGHVVARTISIRVRG